jgi:phosphoesterase RecJ-like protein
MSGYASNATMRDLAGRILAAKRVLVTSHAKPDGDAIGAMLGLGRALAVQGRAADLYTMGAVEPPLLLVARPTPLIAVESHAPGDDHDLVVILDTGAWSQLEPLRAWLGARRERVIGLDHHATGDDVASMRIVEPRAASTSQLVVSLLDELGWAITGGIGGVAEALFMGMASDTGWFRYSSAGEREFTVAARLLRAGVDKTRLFQILEETYRPQRLALEARALTSLEYHGGGAIAVMSLTRDDFSATGGVVEDLTGVVNDPLVVGAVRVSILLAETDGGRTKISLRSKASTNGGPEVDVNAVAQRFGGGGHRHAAGARLAASLGDTRARVLAALDGLI